MQIADIWLRDMPQQFQGKHNIEVLVKAFSKQMQELEKVFQDINTMTDIDTATGKNLDYVGTIIPLTRKEAHIIIRSAENTEITDEIYRQVLRYKAISNSCDCTYYDIMDSINLLWDTDNIKYVEPIDRPATILLSMPTVSLDAADPSVGRVLAIKPAGVGIIYTIGYYTKFPLKNYEKILLPKITMQWSLDGSRLLDSEIWSAKLMLNFGDIFYESNILCCETVRCFLNHSYKVRAKGIENRFKINELSEVSEKIILTADAKNSNDISVNVITKKNIWYLDGNSLLDGSRYLNAIEKKEVI